VLKSDYILIIASSARMLTLAAKNTGLKPLVIDLFADQDTQIYALDFQQITDLTIASLAPAVDYFSQHYAVTQLIVGSGFEQYPDSLHYLHSRLILLGNTPETFIRVQNKVDFFAVLDKFNIPYPETSFTQPNSTQEWLIKPNSGQGGVGIQRFQNTNLGLNSLMYWQKYQHGSQHSVLFLANGQQVQVIGFNTQWTIRLSDTEEFIFAGIINYCELSESHQTQIIDWLIKLVPVFGLNGLNSLDFIHADGQSTVLEINPRPSASMQCYDANLLCRHIMTASPLQDWQSCLHPPPQSGYTGYQIIYAEQDIQIPNGYIWEHGAMDIPAAGAICKTGQPICSIIAHHSQAHAVLNELTLKQHTIKKGLYSHGIQR
jgi:methenyltetrahydromethanopterin cyclohydrolase